MRILKVLSPHFTKNLISILEAEVRPFLEPDVSTYAKGRTRAWLLNEPQLTSNSNDPIKVIPKPLLNGIEETICRIFESEKFEVNTILCINGPAGIKPHRDGSYADPKAIGINLGTVKWWYGLNRTNTELVEVDLPVGAVYTFDCKVLHGSDPIDPNRWAINGWKWAKNRTFTQA